MRWDEAEHALSGLVFANDLWDLDFLSLVIHSYQNLVWPPVHPLFLSIIFLLFGKSIIAGRTFSLLIYFLFLVSMYLLGRELVKKDKEISGTLCSVFALVTWSLYFSASEVMLEIVALLFFTLTLILFLRSFRNKRYCPFVSLFILLTFFSRTNFGVILILSIALYFLIQQRFQIKKTLHERDFIITLGPVLIVILLWLLIPPERMLVFIGLLVNRPEGAHSLSPEGISYYPIQLYIYSGPLIFLYVLALVVSLRYHKNDSIKFLLIVVFLTILLNFFHQNKKIRYILYIYPALFSLTSFHLTGLYSRVVNKRKRFIFFIFLAVSMIAYSSHLSSIIFYDTWYSVSEPLDFIKDNTIDSEKIFILGEFNELSPGLITWHLSNISNIKQVKASSYSLWEFENINKLVVKPLEIPEKPSYDDEKFKTFIEKNGFDSIITLELRNDSFFYDTDDYLKYNKWKLGYIPIVQKNENYFLQQKRFFDGMKVEICVFKRISS